MGRRIGRPTLQKEEIDRFQQRLCELALHQFADHGYAGVTLKGLARDLECSYAKPYRYFKDKAHIFAAVRALAYERFGAALSSAADHITDPRQRLQALGGAYVAFAREQPQAYRIMFELSQPGTDLHPEYWAKERDTWTVWLEAVQHAIDVGYLAGDPSLIAHMFWSGLHGVAALHLAGKLILGQSIDTLATEIFDALLATHEAGETSN